MIKETDIAMCIEKSITSDGYWINKQKVADRLQISPENIESIIKKSNTIVLNSLGELTTRKLYKKKTPFLGKLLDTIKNTID